EAALQPARVALVPLDGDHSRAGRGQRGGHRAQPGTEVEHQVARPDPGVGDQSRGDAAIEEVDPGGTRPPGHGTSPASARPGRYPTPARPARELPGSARYLGPRANQGPARARTNGRRIDRPPNRLAGN